MASTWKLLLLLCFVELRFSTAARTRISKIDPDDDDEEWFDAPDSADWAPECLKDEDCRGFQGKCTDGTCWYTSNEMVEGDKDWEQCTAGCEGFFDDFFESPSADGSGCTGLLCNFWKNVLGNLTDHGSAEASAAEWKLLVSELAGVDKNSVSAVPGLTPGSRQASTNCYCSRLCEMGSAAGVGRDTKFWTSLATRSSGRREKELNRLSMMEVVNAQYQGDACEDVHTMSLSAITYVAEVASKAPAEDAMGSSAIQLHSASTDRMSSLATVSKHRAAVGFAPANCLKKLTFFVWDNVMSYGSAAQDAKVYGSSAAFGALGTVKAAKWSQNFLSHVNHTVAMTQNAVERVPLVGKSVSKVIKFMRGDNYDNTLSAAHIVVSLAIGDAPGAVIRAINVGILKIAGGTLGAAFGLTGGAALALTTISGIGISVAVTTAFTAAAGGAATTAAATGVTFGVFKAACQ